GSGRQLMRSTMALVVAFSGCRMTELAQMRRSDIIQDAFRTVIQTKVKKGKKVRSFEIIFKRKDDVCCAAKAIELWLIDKDCTKRNDVGIWLDFEKKRTLGSIGCSKELKIIIMDAGVSKEYAGSTIRHSMMTDLRSKGATKVEVNEFTRHAPGSDCCDIFYFKPTEKRDMEAMILEKVSTPTTSQSTMPGQEALTFGGNSS
ncbi:MAG: hypothetical protein EZS28_034510, partial [Streblomastix strix]